MATCFNCNIVLRYNFQSFLIVDMSRELVSMIESWTNREVANDHRLCNECFSLVLNELNQEHPSSEQRLGHHFVCVWCGVSLAPRSGRRARSLPEDRPERGRIAALIHPRQIPSNARACNACWLRAHWNVGNIELPTVAVAEAMSDEDQMSDEDLDETDDFPVPQNENENEVISNVFLTLFRRTPNTSSHCFVHGCTNIERLRVPKYLKRRILIDIKLYVTKSARVCEEHSSFYNWSELNIMLYSNEFNTTQLEEMLILLSDTSMDRFDFEKVEQMDNNICMYWTGLTIQNFMSIYNVTESNINNIKKKKMALGLFLAKLRTGESNIRLSSIFNVSLSGVKKYITQIRNSLKINYVPMHLGTTHLSREALSLRNLTIPQGLFGTEENNPIVICDGTYVYVEKSSNYLFQKKSYSLHKYRNLVKPFLIVSTDGHILDVFGPYPATTSDANIMINLFEDPESELRNYFQRNDVFILDRGFRDSLGLLSSLGYTVYKPETRGINEGTQLSTIRANKSRLVTMCRWVVEVVNGRFKRDFKIFRSNYFNKMSKHLIDDFRIAASIINNFHPAITDRSDANSILERALQRMDIPNHLANHVEVNHLNRLRANFVSIDGDLPQLDMFPVMTMDDLVLFALGTYQIKQARSYYGEHIRTNGTFVVEVSNELTTTNIPGVSTSSHETLLIRGRIRSRHQTNKMYYTYISLNCVEGIWQERISAYYCSCIIGKRTVGTCAHVMTMVWYFGWARHQNNIPPPAAFLDRILLGS